MQMISTKEMFNKLIEQKEAILFVWFLKIHANWSLFKFNCNHFNNLINIGGVRFTGHMYRYICIWMVENSVIVKSALEKCSVTVNWRNWWCSCRIHFARCNIYTCITYFDHTAHRYCIPSVSLVYICNWFTLPDLALRFLKSL